MTCLSAFPGPLPCAESEFLGRIASEEKHDHHYPWVKQSKWQESCRGGKIMTGVVY